MRAGFVTSFESCAFVFSSRRRHTRSEEHTSALQSLTNLVCRLLLEKKKKKVSLHTVFTTNAKITQPIQSSMSSSKDLMPQSDLCIDFTLCECSLHVLSIY